MVLMSSATPDELVDPELPPRRLLFRLFHEDGVRVFETQPLEARCRCSRERIGGILRSLPRTDIEEMRADPVTTVTCEFCNTTYHFTPDDLAPLELVGNGLRLRFRHPGSREAPGIGKREGMAPWCCFGLNSGTRPAAFSLFLFRPRFAVSAGNQQQMPARPLAPRGFRGGGGLILQEKNSKHPTAIAPTRGTASFILPQCGGFRVVAGAWSGHAGYGTGDVAVPAQRGRSSLAIAANASPPRSLGRASGEQEHFEGKDARAFLAVRSRK